MSADPDLRDCQQCGKRLPRSEMFGVEDDLRCPDCAQGVRVRMHVRKRPVLVEKAPLVTPIALGIAVVLFVITEFVLPRQGPQSGLYAAIEAIRQRPPVWTGEWWRHVGAVFLHGGFFHILMNGMAIWFLGRVVEMGWGRGTALLLLLGTGCASMAAQWIVSAPIQSVGLSGALFGMCGFLWALHKVHPLAAAVMTERMRNWILTMLVIGVILSQTGAYPIGNMAHGAGLVLGYLFGLAYRHPKRRLVIPAVTVLCIGVMVLAQFWTFGSVRYPDGHTVTREAIRKEYVRRKAAAARVQEENERMQEFLRQLQELQREQAPGGTEEKPPPGQPPVAPPGGDAPPTPKDGGD